MTSRFAIITEGADDWHFCFHFRNTHPQIPEFDTPRNEGYQEALADFRVRIKAANEIAVGIILDADDNLEGKWRAVKTILQSSGYPEDQIPSMIASEGAIIDVTDMPRAGIWIMPDNKSLGMLEDFVALLIPEGDDLWPLAKDTVDKLPERTRRYKPNYHRKAQVHTWLAWQEEPGTPLGQALTKKYLDPSNEVGRLFAAWMTALCAEPAV